MLLATCNGMPWLPEQVESLLAQREVEVHVLVSDDGSSDGTLQWLEAAAAREGRLEILPFERRSGSAAANFVQLIAHAQAAGRCCVAFSDQDDLWFPDKLATAFRCLADAHAQLYSAAVSACWPDGRSTVLAQSGRIRAADFCFEGAGQGCTFVMTSDLYTRVRAFVLAHRAEIARVHYHDWMVYALTRSFGKTWVHDPEPQMSYRQHASNDTGARASLAGIARRIALIRSGWYGRQVATILDICHAAAPLQPAVVEARELMARSGRSVADRWRWARFALVHSRRRLRDRLVVVTAVLLGHL